MDWNVITSNLPFIAGGMVLTFQLALIAILGGLCFGIILAQARLSKKKWLYYPATAYVHFFRGLPLILVIFWIYFLMPVCTGHTLGEFPSVVIAFILYEAAYFSEILRAGIRSIPKGQLLSAAASGLTPFQTARFVILPQALTNMVPALVTHFVVVFQDTSLAYVVGLREFLRRVNLVDAREARSLELYLFAGTVYFIICSLGTLASRQFEKKAKGVRFD